MAILIWTTGRTENCMKYTAPDYYHAFKCIAGECPATCCAGWQIVIDERSLERYKKYKGAFGSRLANSIDWEEGTFHQYHGRCAFLDENNLCDIYTEAGPHMFCRTCRNYPRHIEEFENEREISLSLSCPVAAELILGRKEKVTFLTAEKDCGEEVDDAFDFFLYSALQDCRSVMLEILQDREQPIAFRMAKVLALAHDVQNRIDAGRIFEIETLLERYQRAGADEKLKAKFALYRDEEGQSGRNEALVGLLDELEVLDPSWTEQLKVYREILYGKRHAGCTAENGAAEAKGTDGDDSAGSRCADGKDSAGSRCADRRDSAGIRDISGSCSDESVDIDDTVLEQVMVYFVFTYFCGAVYDDDALAKVKMAVVCTLILRELWKADAVLIHEMQNSAAEEEIVQKSGDSERQTDLTDRADVSDGADVSDRADVTGQSCDSVRNRTAWRFSRELEHSDPNLNKMEELMNEHEAASFEILLRLTGSLGQ